MTHQEKEGIKELRNQGFSYSIIAKTLLISENTVKSFCQRNSLGGPFVKNSNEAPGDYCAHCKNLLKHIPGAKRKKFCSDQCRMNWWNSHTQEVKHKKVFSYVCQYCGGAFESYGSRKRKYCSRACYGKSKEANHE